jgi:hypothetical protein
MPLILMLIAAAVVFKFAWLIAWLVAAAVAGRLIGGWLAGRDDAVAARRWRDAEICARADRQHAAVLAGDELVGVHGDYPPRA